MKRLLPLFVGIFLAAAPAFAQDKPADKTAAKPAGKSAGTSKSASGTATKTMTATGTVSSVAADSLTVKGSSGDMTFAVDDKTHVVAKGASHKSAAAKGDNKMTPITDFVKVGDAVSVKYHDMGATKHAASVTVRTSTEGAASKTPKK
jgi:hypothetical protein